MNLLDYKSSLTQPLHHATLVFLTRPDEILLAMKKRGFGQGRWNGVGGKVAAGESIAVAAIRETKEEIGVLPEQLEPMAQLDFYFATVPEEKLWNQSVFVYFSSKWQGEPKESEEMAPAWYRQSELPFASMWPDDAHWLPEVLAGKKLHAEFLFGEKDAILDFTIRETTDLIFNGDATKNNRAINR